MKLLAYALISLISAMTYSTTLFAHSTESNILKVYVIAGQSNASAIGSADYYPIQERGLKLDLTDITNIADIKYSFWSGRGNECVESGQKVDLATRNAQNDDFTVCPPGANVSRVDPYISGELDGDRFIPMEFDPTNNGAGRFGIEASMAKRLKNRRNSNFTIIKVFHGGTNLYRDWDSRIQSATPYSYKLYSQSVIEIRDRLDELSVNNPSKTIQLAGLIWIQGETDSTSSKWYTTYESNLTALIDDFRTEFGTADLPVYIAELSARPSRQGTAMIKDAQWAMVQQFKDGGRNIWRKNVELIHTSDLEFDQSGVHYTAPSYVKIGQRVADKIISIETQDAVNDIRPELIQYYNAEQIDFRSTTKLPTSSASGQKYSFRRHLGRLYTNGNNERLRLIECKRINASGNHDHLLRTRSLGANIVCGGQGESLVANLGFIHKHPLAGQRSPLYRCFSLELKTNLIGTDTSLRNSLF